jgi:Ca2+-binding RTX toxin-like protein
MRLAWRGVLVMAAGFAVFVAPTPVASAAVASYVANHVLHISGDGAPDSVTVTCASGKAKVNGANPDDGVVSCASLVSIYVETFAGADSVDLSGVTKAAFSHMYEPDVIAGAGADDVTTSPWGAFVSGGTENDTITGLGGPDRLAGDDGSDTVNGGGGIDTVGGVLTGVSTLTDSQLIDGTGTDALTGIETAVLSPKGSFDGSAFSGPQRINILNDGAVTTGDARDTIVFEGGTNGSADAGAGSDTVEVQAVSDVSLDPGQVTSAGGTLTLSGFERASVKWLSFASAGGTVAARDWAKPLRYQNESTRKVIFLGGHGPDHAFGGPGRDILKGFGGLDRLFGLGGKDLLIGGPGNDALRGGPGSDTLRGGPGMDSCSGGPGVDVVSGCES